MADEQLDPEVEEEVEKLFASSERLTAQTERIVRTSRIYVAVHYILVFVVVILWAASSITLTPHSTHLTDVSNVLLIFVYIVFLALVIVYILHRRYKSNSFRQIEHMAQTEVLQKQLQNVQPALYMLFSVMNRLNDEKDEAAARRDFWASIAQNLVFVVLGFLISYALARLGWLR